VIVCRLERAMTDQTRRFKAVAFEKASL
jgi:hypothetical protein